MTAISRRSSAATTAGNEQPPPIHIPKGLQLLAGGRAQRPPPVRTTASHPYPEGITAISRRSSEANTAGYQRPPKRSPTPKGSQKSVDGHSLPPHTRSKPSLLSPPQFRRATRDLMHNRRAARRPRPTLTGSRPTAAARAFQPIRSTPQASPQRAADEAPELARPKNRPSAKYRAPPP